MIGGVVTREPLGNSPLRSMCCVLTCCAMASAHRVAVIRRSPRYRQTYLASAGRKQTGPGARIEMHVVTQLVRSGGGASLMRIFASTARLLFMSVWPDPHRCPNLIGYAMQCGLGASLRARCRHDAMRNVRGLATSPDRCSPHRPYARADDAHRRLHFYPSSGLPTARWLRAVADGASH